jgi:acetylornithine deacetylase/succinyl-diaminopimelate desuccinylase-like protein
MTISAEEGIALFKEMIRIDTTNPDGNEVLMTDYIASILDAHGIEHTVWETAERRANLVASIGPESDKRPILFISHTDVVSCEGQDWTHPPFDAVESDGFIYGRGTMDTKHLTAMQLIAFLRASEWKLNRKVYFVAAADEEQGSTLGMQEIEKRYRDAFRGAYVINEGGGFYVENDGKPYYLCTVGEKGRCTVHVVLEGDSGPASFKCENRVLDKFASLLDAMASCPLPFCDNPVHRKFSERLGTKIDNPMLKQFERYLGHDAIILQRYDIGTQVNVLPYRIEFDFTLQLLPGKTREDAQAILDGIFRDRDASYAITGFRQGFAGSCENRFFSTMEDLVYGEYGKATLLPVYALGQTDGRFLGPLPCDVYGFSPVTKAIGFEEVLAMVHRADERIDRESVPKGADFLTEILKRIGCEEDD